MATTESAPATLDVEITREIARRRTFAIISHPDAGKTTLTEKLLLYGGAVHLAGVRERAQGAARTRPPTGWSWSSSAASPSPPPCCSSSTTAAASTCSTRPGHQDFSEDTYRTLTAVDSAVMVIDAAKGVEPQTRKLFEVCRQRGHPDLHVHQQAGPPGARAARAARRDREGAGHRRRRR